MSSYATSNSAEVALMNSGSLSQPQGDPLYGFIQSIVQKAIDAAINDGRLMAIPVPTIHGEKDNLTARQVAERYGITTSTLQDWRTRSKGPAWSKPGKHVMYKLADCEAYFGSKRVRTLESDRLAVSHR